MYSLDLPSDVLTLLLQVYSQNRVFISHAGPQKGFALHLRSRLRDAGISTFVDERELLPGASHTAAANMEAACRQADLVIFVITREFLRRAATMQELRWALDQRDRQRTAAATGADGGPAAALPHLLTVLYPTSVSPSWREPELQQLLYAELTQLAPGAAPAEVAAAARRINVATTDATVDIGQLSSGSLSSLLQLYHAGASAAYGPPEAITAEQAAADLQQLATHSVVRSDSVARLAHVHETHIWPVS
jgi:TIR domain